LTLDDCFSERKLRKAKPDAAKAKKSVSTARAMLAEASGLSKSGFHRMALVSAYASMFHACRALLFRDGIVEKSHYCLALYVRKNYAEKGAIPVGLMTALDGLREERHDALYGLTGAAPGSDDSKMAIDSAGKLLEIIEKLLGK